MGNNLENIGRGVLGKGQEAGEIISKIYKSILGSSKDIKDIASRIAGANDMYEVVMKNEKISQIEKERILESEEIEKLAIAMSNLEKVEEYIGRNKVGEEIARKLRAGAVEEGSFVHVEEDGKIYMSKFGSRDSYENGVLHLSIEIVSYEEMTSKEYLANIKLSDTEEVYISKIKKAKASIADMLLETRFFGKLKIDMEEVGSDTASLLMDITKGLHNKEVYKGAFDALRELPQGWKEVFDLVSTLSNAEVLSKVVKKGYETVKEDPKEAGLFILSTLTSYDIYKMGISSENQIYGAGLIFVGLVLDGGTKVLKTAEAIREVAKEAKKIGNMLREKGQE